MYKVEITSSKDKVIKTYEQSGIYMLSATFEDNMITLDRAVKDGDTYTGTAQDYITSSEEAKESNIYVQTYKTDLKETQVRLTYDDGISDKEPKLLKPKQVVLENVPQVSLNQKRKQTHFMCMVMEGFRELIILQEKRFRKPMTVAESWLMLIRITSGSVETAI